MTKNMKDSFKSLTIVLIAPVIILNCFFTKVVEVKQPERKPAVERQVKSVKNAVKNYILAVNGVN